MLEERTTAKFIQPSIDLCEKCGIIFLDGVQLKK